MELQSEISLAQKLADKFNKDLNFDTYIKIKAESKIPLSLTKFDIMQTFKNDDDKFKDLAHFFINQVYSKKQTHEIRSVSTSLSTP